MKQKLNKLQIILIGSNNFHLLNIIGGGVATLYSFIGDYIYNDPLSIIVLVLAYKLDFLTAMYKILVNKEKVEISKLPTFIYHLVFISSLLSFSWYLSRTNYMFYFLPSLIYGGTMTQQLLSILQNLTQAKVIDIEYFNKYKDLLLTKLNKQVEDEKRNSGNN